MQMIDGNTALLSQYEHAQAEGARDYEERAPDVIKNIVSEIVDGEMVDGHSAADFVDEMEISDSEIAVLLTADVSSDKFKDLRTRLLAKLASAVTTTMTDTDVGQDTVNARLNDE